MLSTTILSAEKKLGGYATRYAGAIVALLVVLCFSTPAALGGQCTSDWIKGGSGDWNTAGNWNHGVPTNSIHACISDNDNSTVTLDTSGDVLTLALGSSNSLDITAGVLNVSGVSISNSGKITLSAGGGNNTNLQLAVSTGLSGGGTVTLGSTGGTGTAYIMGNGSTLTNANNTIQGYGVIGNGSLALVNQTNGTIEANVSGQTLLLNGSGGLTNNGTMEATNGGTLQVTVGGFSNTGTVTVGTAAGDGSTLKMGASGTGTYTQSSGLTQGSGTINGNVTIKGGIITASDSKNPDILTITGNYKQGPDAVMDAYLLGPLAGTGYSQLVVDGTATLGGTLDVDLTGLFLAANSTDNFFLLDSTGALSGTFTTVDFTGLGGNTEFLKYYDTGCPTDSRGGCVELTLKGPTTVPTPEPSVFLLLFVGMAMMTIVLKYRNMKRSEVE
jgi:hypothetical protein